MIYALLAAIVVLQALDVVTTAKGLRMGLEEANPIARALFGRLPVLPAAIVAKIVSTAPIIAFSLAYPSWWAVPLIFAAATLFIVLRNRSIVGRAGG